MSKRDAGAAVGDTPESEGYEKLGFVSSAVVNFLALLGWSSKTDEEVFTLFQLIERFSLEAVNRSPARFDPEKCAWLNQQHLLRLSDEAFAEAARPFVEAAGLPVGEDFPAIARTVKEKVRLLQEVPEAIRFLLEDQFAYETEALEKVKGNAQAAALMRALADAFATVPEWSADAAKAAIGETAKAAGAKPGQLMFPVRVALSGRAHGPDLGDMLALLGPLRSAMRVKRLGELLDA
jgi:glutamyl/glutaminyl-tRNA synthetase